VINQSDSASQQAWVSPTHVAVGMSFAWLSAPTPLADGFWHTLTVHRMGVTVNVSLDGAPLPMQRIQVPGPVSCMACRCRNVYMIELLKLFMMLLLGASRSRSARLHPGPIQQQRGYSSLPGRRHGNRRRDKGSVPCHFGESLVHAWCRLESSAAFPDGSATRERRPDRLYQRRVRRRRRYCQTAQGSFLTSRRSGPTQL
jgi:hypothetical protein